jgi:hypothetical protein
MPRRRNPASPIYAHSDRGFALISTRSPSKIESLGCTVELSPAA